MTHEKRVSGSFWLSVSFLLKEARLFLPCGTYGSFLATITQLLGKSCLGIKPALRITEVEQCKDSESWVSSLKYGPTSASGLPAMLRNVLIMKAV